MSVQVPAFATDAGYPFWYLRKMMAAFATAGTVNPSTDLIVSPSSGLQVQITSGSAFVQQTVNVEGGSAYNGLYFVINDATTNPVNTISAPVSNPRIDQVILRVYDVQEQGLGGASKGQIEWLQGTESASASLATMGPGLSNPGASALPANSMQLAYVLQTVGESSIAASNLLDVRPRTHGSENIATSQSVTSTTYTTLGTPDQVTGIVLPTSGFLRVWYYATWQESVSNAARAAIFIGSNQLQASLGLDGSSNTVGTVAAATVSGGPANTNTSLVSCPLGIMSDEGGSAGNSVTTGLALAASTKTPPQIEYRGSLTALFTSGSASLHGMVGGPCDIIGLPAGTYTISVQFKASSGSVTAANRLLAVQTIPFT